MRFVSVLVCLLAGYALLSGCTNDYDDLAYVPPERARPGACNDDGDCAGDDDGAPLDEQRRTRDGRGQLPHG